MRKSAVCQSKTWSVKALSVKALSVVTGCGLAAGCGASTTAQQLARPELQPASAPSASASAAVSSNTKPIRIMTAGDSLTAVFRYQKTLREKLKQGDVSAIFVGSQGEGDGRNEGYSGWQIGQLEDNIVGWMDKEKPGVVLLQIGTNNMNHGLGLKGKAYPPYQEGTPAQAAQPAKTLDELGATWGDKTYGSKYLRERIDGLLDKILAQPNKPGLLVAQIPPIGRGNAKFQQENDDCMARIREFNAMLKAAVEGRRKAGKPIVLVDNFSGLNRDYGTTSMYAWGDEKSQSSDWVHPRPDALAWTRMGERFHAGLKALLKK